MIGKIGEFLASLPRELYVFLISILPIIELRGAIPVGAALGLPFYLNYGLSVLGNLLPVPLILMFIPKILDFLGSFKFFRPMVNWLKEKAEKNKGKIIKEEPDNTEVKDVAESSDETESNCVAESNAKTESNCVAESNHDLPEQTIEPTKKKKRLTMGVFLGLMLFVAIPLPGTGAWTGSLVAALFGLPKRQSLLAVALGVLICGAIMCLASYGILGFLSFLA